MGERSLFGNFMLVVIAVIVAVGLYWLIGAVDVYRIRNEHLVREVRAVKEEVGRLRTELQDGAFSSVPRSRGARGTDLPRFANLQARDPKAEEGDTLAMVTGAETANLNYLVNNESQVGDYWGMTNDSLAERNLEEPTRWEPKLATHWEISDDKLTYTIHLRQGVYWHDFTDPTTGESYSGVEVTSDDFKFFVDVVQNPKIPCDPMRVYYKDLEGIKVLDKHTFQVVWKEPYFMSESLTLGLSPLPKHFYQFAADHPEGFTENTSRNRMIVGCGPWVFERWDKGKELTFRRNENYYAPKPYMHGRRFKVIKEPNARLLALRNGEIDRVGLSADQWMDQTQDETFRKRFNRFKYSRRVYYYIGYNMRRELFKDRRVRLAMTHLVDRQRILKEVYRGLGRIVTGNFFIDSPYYDHSIEPYAFDTDKAKALLAEAGWRDTDGDGVLDRDKKKFEFSFLAIAHSENQARIAAILKENMARAGVLMNIVSLEWSVYTQRLDEWNYDVCSLGWAMGYESDPYQIWHSSQAKKKKASNHVGFVNAEADEIIEKARREFDLEKRIRMYNRFHQILHEEQPYTVLVTPEALVAQDKRLRNAKVYPLGMHPDAFWVPKAEQKYKD